METKKTLKEVFEAWAALPPDQQEQHLQLARGENEWLNNFNALSAEERTGLFLLVDGFQRGRGATAKPAAAGKTRASRKKKNALGKGMEQLAGTTQAGGTQA